jgi:ubiquitin carboxyl-terminal hydrolase L3
MLSLLPRPVNALILLCDESIYKATRSKVEPTIPEYTGSGDSPVLWMRQTIGHACGLMALLHVVLNLDNGKHVTTGSELGKLAKQAVQLAPKERAELLYNSKFLEESHMDAASEGSSIVPLPQEECRFHFIAFVKKEGEVWELNGGMNGPLRRGKLESNLDLLSDEGLDLTVRDFFRSAETEVNRGISIVAVV